MSRQTRISMIAAVAANGVIGRDNAIPWKLPADLAYFKRTTMGHPVVMGRRTFESIGRPLPGRLNIVLSRNPDWSADGCIVVRTAQEAIDAAATAGGETGAGGEDELFVIGGTELYKLFLPLADRLYVTQIGQSFDGDAVFPDIDPQLWEVVDRQPGVLNEKNKYPHTFVTYERNNKMG